MRLPNQASPIPGTASPAYTPSVSYVEDNPYDIVRDDGEYDFELPDCDPLPSDDDDDHHNALRNDRNDSNLRAPSALLSPVRTSAQPESASSQRPGGHKRANERMSSAQRSRNTNFEAKPTKRAKRVGLRATVPVLSVRTPTPRRSQQTTQSVVADPPRPTRNIRNRRTNTTRPARTEVAKEIVHDDSDDAIKSVGFLRTNARTD